MGQRRVMARAEREGLPYLFRLRATANVKRALERAMAERDWSDAGHGWQGKETNLRLMGWSRQRRVVLLRRQFNRPLALLDRTDPGQPLLGFAGARRQAGGVGICRLGDVAGQRNSHPGSALPGPCGLRERV